MRTSKEIQEVLREGESHSKFYCDTCGWAEDRADLSACATCAGFLSCRDCRDSHNACIWCAEMALPDKIQLVGQDDKYDVKVNVMTWVGTIASATHYYIHFKTPYKHNRYGRLVIEETSKNTERLDEVAPIIRKVLSLIANRSSIKRRKVPKLRVYIDHHETVQRFMKYGILDGD